jgi:very-short-patch-repair endonuclease
VPNDCGPWVDDLATKAALVADDMRVKTVLRRIRVGTWQEPAPGVVCRTTGELTRRQWWRTALLYVGPEGALSHGTAAARWLRLPAGPRVIVTTDGHRPRSTERIWVRQSRRPYRVTHLEGLRTTVPARSVLDAALDLRRQEDVDDIMGRALQAKLVTVDELGDELDAAPSGGSRFARLALSELAAGSHAASEAQLMRLIRRAALPEPQLNAAVHTITGVKYVDALWAHLCRGVEVDGQAYHLSPAQWRADLARQNEIQSTGIVLLRIAARRLWTEPDALIREIRIFLGG